MRWEGRRWEGGTEETEEEGMRSDELERWGRGKTNRMEVKKEKVEVEGDKGRVVMEKRLGVRGEMRDSCEYEGRKVW